MIGLAFLSFITSVVHTTALENRASLATQELKNSLALLGTELRMSSAVSPYIVGNTASVVTLQFRTFRDFHQVKILDGSR